MSNVGPGSARVCRCGKTFSGGRLRKYCNRKCRVAVTIERYHKNRVARGYSLDLATATIGAVHELVVAVDLMKRGGLFVYRSMDPSSPCDLMIYNAKSGCVTRVEVTTGTPRATGELSATPVKLRATGVSCDVLAIVCHDGRIDYVDPRGLLTTAAPKENGPVAA